MVKSRIIQYNSVMVSNDSRTKRFFRIIFSQAAVGFLMVIIAFTILFFAQGYRINFKNFKIVKTGIIYISSLPKGAGVLVNSKAKSDKTPFAESLRPGFYDVEVKKDGYITWAERFKIEPEFVTEFEKVVLVKSDITPVELTDQDKIALLNAPIDALINSGNGLTHNDYEIWNGDKLITRFSEPITKATWYIDTVHIIYQQKDEIRIMELSGKNDTLLVKLSTADPSIYRTNNKGDELYFTDNGNYKMAKIR